MKTALPASKRNLVINCKEKNRQLDRGEYHLLLSSFKASSFFAYIVLALKCVILLFDWNFVRCSMPLELLELSSSEKHCLGACFGPFG